MAAPAQAIWDPLSVLHAYRHLYRQGLKVIRYSKPSRYVLRATLRTAFRETPREQFDASRVANTLRFLERAADTIGFEHRIVKNLLVTRYWETTPIGKDSRILRNLGLGNMESRLRKSAHQHFDLTLERLNESLGTCLR
ncbi:hypothetical protein N7532_000159 [Penicillium argentinense]|uniref:Uncharacterized protein n=1 Tax=Penicillium argentinense TaxID=1131581 RepID=A0A9W9G4Z1_9EURO|nr:uncharacterized protein N7532_000159 [Penicillium argentinense]KAJ5112114.1 hypothetical protein N7532_000159 [Penicillium argentinense]